MVHCLEQVAGPPRKQLGFLFNYILGRAVVLQFHDVGNSQIPQLAFFFVPIICVIEAVSDLIVRVDCCCGDGKYLGQSLMVTPMMILLFVILNFITVIPFLQVSNCQCQMQYQMDQLQEALHYCRHSLIWAPSQQLM